MPLFNAVIGRQLRVTVMHSRFSNPVALANGDLLANWGAGFTKDCDHERLEFSRSNDLGESWSEPFLPV